MNNILIKRGGLRCGLLHGGMRYVAMAQTNYYWDGGAGTGALAWTATDTSSWYGGITSTPPSLPAA